MNIKKFAQGLKESFTVKQFNDLKVELGLIEKEIKPIVKKDILERLNLFAKELYSPKYQSVIKMKILDSFYNYWTEPNNSKTKMRFEMQKTWDLKRRLETWVKNSDKFNKGKDEPKQSRFEKLKSYKNGASINK